jgi:hypothetical protein
MSAAGDVTYVPIAGSAVPDQYIDNELATNATAPGGLAKRQRTADNDAQQLLSDIATLMRMLVSNTPARDGSLDAGRVTLAGTTNNIATVTTVSSVSSVTGVTTVTTVTGQTNAGGFNMLAGQIALANSQAAALRSKISVTPLWPSSSASSMRSTMTSRSIWASS